MGVFGVSVVSFSWSAFMCYLVLLQRFYVNYKIFVFLREDCVEFEEIVALEKRVNFSNKILSLMILNTFTIGTLLRTPKITSLTK